MNELVSGLRQENESQKAEIEDLNENIMEL